MVASRPAVRKRVCMSKGVISKCVDVSVCACVSEGQLDLIGVSGVGRPGSPGQGAPATTIGISWATQLAILKERAASPSPRLALDTT